jgi:hypothetical protein
MFCFVFCTFVKMINTATKKDCPTVSSSWKYSIPFLRIHSFFFEIFTLDLNVLWNCEYQPCVYLLLFSFFSIYSLFLFCNGKINHCMCFYLYHEMILFVVCRFYSMHQTRNVLSKQITLWELSVGLIRKLDYTKQIAL